MIEKKQNVNDYSIQLNPKLQKIFSEIIRDSQYSSSELLKKYLETPEFQIYSEQLRNKWQELLQQIIEERKKHMELSNQEFFSFILNQYSVKIIERIKENYAGKLTHEILDRLNNFNLEIKNDESFKHDMTAYPDKSLISINMAYFAKGKSLEQQVVQAMGTMPHEIFHFIFQILKPKQLADERMVFKLADGNTASSLGMVGHMLNEGFVEKLSSDFCEKNGIFYTISPSYIQFVNLCNYIMKHNPQITEDFLINHNYEDILSMCSSDVVETYKKTERIEYANRFSLKMPDGSYRNIKSNEILKSFNQPVDTNSNIFGRRYNYYIRNYRFGDLKHNSYEKLLQIAKQNGFSSLGFCEHIPNLNLILPDEDNRMLLSEVKEYIDSINTLKRDNPEMTLSTKKLEVTRKKKAVEETDQVLANQQGVMGNAKKNLTNAIKMGCNTSQEFTDVITQMTEYDSTNKVEHKVDIESQLSKFEESKSNANTLTSTNNLVLTKTPNTSINDNGSANIILIILLVTFAIGFVFGVTYVFCRLWING